MPIGLFENELTVQLWRPVTIRGYTFNIADNVTLDQTKIDSRRQESPASGGDFAWLFSTYQAERTGKPLNHSGIGCRRPSCGKGTRFRPPG